MRHGGPVLRHASPIIINSAGSMIQKHGKEQMLAKYLDTRRVVVMVVKVDFTHEGDCFYSVGWQVRCGKRVG